MTHHRTLSIVREPVGSWADLANCKGWDDLMFPKQARPGRDPNWTPARQLCNNCQVRTDCLQHALRNREKHGMWGGTTPDERRVILGRHRRWTS